MAFNVMPTSEQLERYIANRFDEAICAKVMDSLAHVSASHGKQRTWLQAAILTEWEAETPQASASDERISFTSLDSKVRTVNNDPRDFLLTFRGPFGWENRFH